MIVIFEIFWSRLVLYFITFKIYNLLVMNLESVIPDIMPHYVQIGHIMLSQSLIAGLIGTGIFSILILIYIVLKRTNHHCYFVQIVEYIYENIYAFLDEIGWGSVGKYALLFTAVFVVTLLAVTFISLNVIWGQSRLIMLYLPFILFCIFFNSM